MFLQLSSPDAFLAIFSSFSPAAAPGAVLPTASEWFLHSTVSECLARVTFVDRVVNCIRSRAMATVFHTIFRLCSGNCCLAPCSFDSLCPLESFWSTVRAHHRYHRPAAIESILYTPNLGLPIAIPIDCWAAASENHAPRVPLAAAKVAQAVDVLASVTHPE